MPDGPTLSEDYNHIFAQWLRGHPDITPECECCGGDMTGQMVHEVDSSWVCPECKHSAHVRPVGYGGMSFAAESAWERRQMGLSNF